MRNPISGLYEALVAGADVASRFAGDATVNSPLRGSQPVVDWVRDEAAWLADNQMEVQAINHIVTDSHASAEYSLAITREREAIDLPLHLVADLGGDQITALRTYHSTYPLTGGAHHPPTPCPPCCGHSARPSD